MFWTNQVQKRQSVAVAIRSLVNAIMYGDETMIRKEKERSRVRAVQMDNLRGELIVSNARIRESCEVTKRVDERIDEGILQWFDHVERMIGVCR